ncbi:hypothetical protein ABTZ03_42300 [Kitasatospora sp. NPDC096077]|uniref:hypothetical protein n=1 Tax=Kitasatospora sp. NPDC096077 TaxID=3155544 RepID=UPI0033320C65
MTDIDFPLWDTVSSAPARPEATRVTMEGGNSLQSVRLLRGSRYPQEWVAAYSFPPSFRGVGHWNFSGVALNDFIQELGQLESDHDPDAFRRLSEALLPLDAAMPTSRTTVLVDGVTVDALRFQVLDVGWLLVSDDHNFDFAIAGMHSAEVPALRRAAVDIWEDAVAERIRQLLK